jgi:hypothetical protein
MFRITAQCSPLKANSLPEFRCRLVPTADFYLQFQEFKNEI